MIPHCKNLNGDILKIIYIDLDGVIADFTTAIEKHPLRNQAPYDIHPDTIPNVFLNLGTIPGAMNPHYIL